MFLLLFTLKGHEIVFKKYKSGHLKYKIKHFRNFTGKCILMVEMVYHLRTNEFKLSQKSFGNTTRFPD